MQEDSFLYSSPGAEASDHHQPVSDFLTSIHAGWDDHDHHGNDHDHDVDEHGDGGDDLSISFASRVESPKDEDEAALRQLPVRFVIIIIIFVIVIIIIIIFVVVVTTEMENMSFYLSFLSITSVHELHFLPVW